MLRQSLREFALPSRPMQELIRRRPRRTVAFIINREPIHMQMMMHGEGIHHKKVHILEPIVWDGPHNDQLEFGVGFFRSSDQWSASCPRGFVQYQPIG
jgi:hypothetical protein